MDEKKFATGTDEHYEETTDPRNPPESILRSGARTGWLMSSVGMLAVIFLVVAGLFGWVYVRHELGSQPQTYPDPRATGTSGEQQPREGTPGGFNPSDGAFHNTRDELKFRGSGGLTSGPSSRSRETTGTSGQEPAPLGDIKDATIGTRVTLSNVTVERTEGSMFWVRSGDTAVAVTVSGDTPTVKTGQRVDITGTVESTAEMRIRASRIGVR